MKVVLAVSGGVDSMVMLDVLRKRRSDLVVAHVDHGIRSDSHMDAELVEKVAKTHNLMFETVSLRLDGDASEELARAKRYEWLERVAKKHGTEIIATAHHRDDIIETVIINLIRGTGWRGLCSLRETQNRSRPLLGMTKAEIVAHAIEHKLEWREDSTNDSTAYLRNRIRQRLQSIDDHKKQLVIDLYQHQCSLRQEIDVQLSEATKEWLVEGAFQRYPLVMCEDVVAKELLQTWLRGSLEQRHMSRLLLFAKAAKRGDKFSLDARQYVRATPSSLIVETKDN